MSFLRPIQWYHSQADPIWPDGTLKNKYKALSTLLNSAEYSITRERILLIASLKLDTATGGLNVAITSHAVVYAPAERAEKFLLFLLYPCLLYECIRGDRKNPHLVFPSRNKTYNTHHLLCTPG